MSEQQETYVPEVVQPGTTALAAFEAILDAVPEVGEEAWESIITTIMSASSAEDLDKPWRADSFRELNGVEVVVESIQRAPSDFQDGLGVYLVVRAVRCDTGESFVGTSGAVGVVAQLVRAHVLGAFPLKVIPRVAERPTKKGYHPMHLEIMR